MENTPPDPRGSRQISDSFEPSYVTVEVVPEPPEEQWAPPPRRFRRRVWVPVILFVLTCASTLEVGSRLGSAGSKPWMYALPLMTILLCHEAGHFLQAWRYRVFASFPYFIPMPYSPIGTLGAVIGMEARVGDRKALFDIGITGPLAGLVPTIVCCTLGLRWSELVRVPDGIPGSLGEPLLFKGLAWMTFGRLPEGVDILLHPVAYAGWVGLLITALNLFPIGQLDGGHVLYGLLRRRAHSVAWLLLVGAGASMLIAAFGCGYVPVLQWLLMSVLLLAMGPRHPPTANDYVPLGPIRQVLGWLTLAFVPIGFTPVPFWY